MLEPHPLHELVRCPYHPQAGPLAASSSGSRPGSPTLRCGECARHYDTEEGVYRLMPDEFRTDNPSSGADDAEIAQQKREMRQRDERAAVSTGFVRVPESSPQFWLNIQYDAVTRRSVIPTHGLCIDFGTGVGRYIPWLLERAEKIIATDFSFASLRTLQSQLTPTERARCLLIQCDLSKLPIADNAAAAALCTEVLQHLPSVNLRAAAIKEMARTTQPGGHLFLTLKAHPPAARVEGLLRQLKWSLRKLAGKHDPKPVTGQETHDGSIYTYWHTLGELKQLIQPHFQLRAARGIMAYESFPIRYFGRQTRLALNDWLENRPLGRHFARDYHLHLVRPPPPVHNDQSLGIDASAEKRTGIADR